MKNTSRLCCGLAILGMVALYGCNKHDDRSGAGTDLGTVHSAEWYEAHPDTLKGDEKRCAGDAQSISQNACQNVYSAESSLGVKEMKDAADRNNAAPAPLKPK